MNACHPAVELRRFLQQLNCWRNLRVETTLKLSTSVTDWSRHLHLAQVQVCAPPRFDFHFASAQCPLSAAGLLDQRVFMKLFSIRKTSVP